jgi:hypothetical protein
MENLDRKALITKLEEEADKLIKWLEDGNFKTRMEAKASNAWNYSRIAKLGLVELLPKSQKGQHLKGSTHKRAGRQCIGILALYKAIDTPDGPMCGRCKERTPERTINVCNKCYNRHITCARTGEEYNLGNIRDEFCNIYINLENERLYVGLEADASLKRKLYENGYGFILK